MSDSSSSSSDEDIPAPFIMQDDINRARTRGGVTFTLISKIETDYNLVLIQSVLTAFNKQHIMQYLIITTSFNVELDMYPIDMFVVIHIFGLHGMKNSIKKINNETKKNGYCISQKQL